jgi:biopolymer transport protein ExbD
MTWKVRHQGSPRSIEPLTLPEVIEGLQEGQWEPTDEVMGPQDRHWVAIENHPQLAEIAADLEPPATAPPEDETRLDMNPLIDVALVLLIFFILITSYSALQKILEMPTSTPEGPKGPVRVTQAKLDEVAVKVVARKESGKAVIRIEDKVVNEDELEAALRRFVRQTRKTKLVIDAADVEWGTVVAIQDAAQGAGVDGVLFLEKMQPAEEAKKP